MIVAADLLDVWGAAMWRASWQGGVAALAVWSVCWLVPSMPARFQCWLWRLVLLKFVVALVWSMPIELPLLPASTLTSSTLTSSTLPASTLANWESSSPILSNSIPAESIPASPHQLSSFITPWLVPFLAWVVIALWQTARILAACRNANRLRNGCRLSDNKKLIDQLAMLSKSVGLGTPPTLLEMNGQGSPLLVGIIRPAIVLPATTLSRLEAAERTLVLGHELAHVRRCDLAWGVCAAIVRTAFFFHPLAWLSERQLRLTQEMAADELAISLQKYDAVSYAALLVSVVGKLGPARSIPAMSVGMAGSHQSLKQRFTAMRFMKPVSRRIVLAYGIALSTIAVVSIVPWALVAAEAPAVDKPELNAATTSGKQAAEADQTLARAPETKQEKTPEQVADKVPEKVAPKERTERGQFVSFKNGTLTLKANSGELLENKVPTNTTTLVWNDAEGLFKPADTAEALSQAQAGTWFYFHVANDNATIRIGSRKSVTIGTFVSFKDNRLLILGKNLGESFTKKYGNAVHFNKFRDDVPVYESIDGGEYKLVGTPGAVLGNVKEGTIISVHGEGDDNIALVQIGVPKQQQDGKVTFVETGSKQAPADKATEKAAGNAPEKAPYQATKKAADQADQKQRTERGWFVFFADGVLGLRNRGGLVKIKLPENTKTFVWNHDEGRSQGVDTAEAMRQLEALASPVDTAETLMWRKAGIGLVVQVAQENVTIHIGENKAPYAGNFVSFKDDYLFIRLKNPNPQFQKTYGDTVRFRMNEDISVYESIDGGEYKPVGSPRAAFGKVKEGTELSVYHYYKTETDEFYLILVGSKKK